MAKLDGDISWDVLRRIVHDWVGSSAELVEVRPLHGGSMNTTLALTTSAGDRAALKITPHRVNRAFEDEAYQLNVLAQVGLPVPEVYTCEVGSLDAPYSYLLMQYVDGMNFAEAKQACSADQYAQLQSHLAELVLTLHENTATHYTRVTAGQRIEHAVWPAFFREIYDPIWAETRKLGFLPTKLRKQIDRIHDNLDRLLAHDDCPRLVHWDIWATNLLARPDEQGRWWVCAILDPMCKYAHVEAELAYMELFQTTTSAFTRTYQQTRRLTPDYHAVRKGIYQLYALINHVQLFGQEYLEPLAGALAKIGQPKTTPAPIPRANCGA
jgi:fructosamine-3-kinase